MAGTREDSAESVFLGHPARQFWRVPATTSRRARRRRNGERWKYVAENPVQSCKIYRSSGVAGKSRQPHDYFMKQIVLLRHGHALGIAESGAGEDSKRPLSETGKKQAAASAKKLLELKFSPEVLIASPYLRAAQTAAIASSFFPGARRLECAALASGNGPAVLELLELELKNAASALVVGHQPLLGTIGGFLLGSESFNLTSGGFMYLRFKTAGAPHESELVEFFSPGKP